MLKMRKKPLVKSSLPLAITTLLGVLASLAPSEYLVGGVIKMIFNGRRSSYDSLVNSLEFASYKCALDYENSALLQEKDIAFDGFSLHTYLYDNPDSDSLVIFAHGLSSMAMGREFIIQNEIIENGYDMLSFDLLASGKSGGDCIRSLYESVYDIEAVLSYAEGLGYNNIMLAGYSWGAYGSVIVGCRHEEVKGIMIFAPFDSPQEVMVYTAKTRVGFLATIALPLVGSGLEYAYGRETMASCLDELNKNPNASICLFQGNKDNIVGFDECSLYSYKSRIKNQDRLSFNVYEGKNHVSLFYSDESISYAEEYVDPLAKSYEKKYGQYEKWSDQIKGEFSLSIDKNLTSTIDPDIKNKIKEYLDERLEA